MVTACIHGTVIAYVLVGRFRPSYSAWYLYDVSVLHVVTVFVFWLNEVTRESLEPLLAIPDIVISLTVVAEGPLLHAIWHSAFAGDVAMTTSKKDFSGAADFPHFPGEECLAHTASSYMEQLNARLTGLGLLAVAQGHPPASVGCIIDEPLDEIPELDPSDSQDHCRVEGLFLVPVGTRRDVSGL